MRKRILCTVVFLGLCTLLVSVSGCSASRINLVDKGCILIEKQDNEKVQILWADVYQQEGQTWVYAVLKQPSTVGGTIKTHLDIQILNPDGNTQYQTISKDIYVPRQRIGRMDWKKVRVKLSDDILEGSKIFLKIHNGARKDCFKENELASNSH